MIGKVVSERYKVKKYLGGGMSSVYQADDIILDREVVVKLIKVDQHDREKSKKRFRREVESTTQLSHPNIVSVLDVDETEEYHLLVTEMMHGPTLKTYIEDGHPIPVGEAVGIAQNILNGIEHAHNAGIIHRDIKPQNILMDEDKKQVKITDFGIAKALSETRMTETNQVMGSVQYISPEQAKGQSTDERTDIYSFGIVLYELLTGKLPFDGETPVSVALKHISEDMPEIYDDRTIPDGLKNIIMRCTDKNPGGRFRLVDDIIIALDDYEAYEAPANDGKDHGLDDKTMVTPVPSGATPIEESTEPGDSSEEDGEPAGRKKKWLGWLWWLIPVFFLVAAAAVVTYFTFLEDELSTVALPEFEDMTVEEAEGILNENELELGEVNEAYHETYEDGRIINSEPASGTDVESGSTVDFTVSEGAEPHIMEDYTGEMLETVEDEVDSLGFNSVEIEEEYDDSEPGTVLSQSVAADEEVHPEDSELTLTVSEGVEPVEIVDYSGDSLDTARAELEDQGFNVSVTQEIYHDTMDEGQVVSQDPSYGSFLPGSTINLIVSLGGEPAREMQYVQNVEIPYPEDGGDGAGEDEDSSEDETDEGNSSEEGSSEDNEPVEVTIYLDDANNDIEDEFETVEITEDHSHTIRLIIEEDAEGAFRIEVDGETFMEETIPYESE